VNVSATFIRGKPVYTPITYKDFKSYILIVFAVGLFIGSFFLGYLFFHRFKVARINKTDKDGNLIAKEDDDIDN